MTRGLWTPGHLWITPFECSPQSCLSSTVLASSHPAYVTRNLPSFDAENAKVAVSAFKSGAIAAEFDAMSCAIIILRRR